MPQYLYANPNNETEIVEIIQSINDPHEYFKDGVKWIRVFTVPTMATDTLCDPYSASDFVRATHKKGTMGDIMDRSKEMSQKRADKEGGRDPIREKYYDNYSKTRKGLVHPDIRKRKSKERLNKLGFGLE